MAIGTTIKTIQDIMRKDGRVDGDAQRISQWVWMIFLKIFDRPFLRLCGGTTVLMAALEN
jgi:type I restriction-modification system DNA methylase subunit